MNQIQKLTQVIRDNAKCDLEYGTLRTLKMIDDESMKTERLAMCEANAQPLLDDVRVLLKRIVEGEYRIFYSDSMDQNTGIEEDIKSLYKRVSEHVI